MIIPNELGSIGFNKQTLSFEVFLNLCKILGVWVAQKPLKHDSGFYYNHDSEAFGRIVPTIVLSSSLSGYMKLWVAWHELAHYLLHPPEIQFFSETTRLKIEHQANIIASCCVIPRPLLKQILKGEVENDYPRDLWQYRCEAAARYGL